MATLSGGKKHLKWCWNWSEVVRFVFAEARCLTQTLQCSQNCAKLLKCDNAGACDAGLNRQAYKQAVELWLIAVLALFQTEFIGTGSQNRCDLKSYRNQINIYLRAEHAEGLFITDWWVYDVPEGNGKSLLSCIMDTRFGYFPAQNTDWNFSTLPITVGQNVKTSFQPLQAVVCCCAGVRLRQLNVLKTYLIHLWLRLRTVVWLTV